MAAFIAATAQSTFSTIISIGNPIVAGSVAWQTGDKVIVIGCMEDNGGSVFLSTPTVTGLTFSQVVTPVQTSGRCWAGAWQADAASASSGAIQAIVNGLGIACGLQVWVIRGHGGLGNASLTFNNTTLTVALTTTANSIVLAGIFDWAAADATHALTPTSSPTPTERADGQFASHYSWEVGDWVGVAAGSANYGITSSAGPTLNTVLVEVLDAPRTSYSDDFNRADGAPGANWATPGNLLSIVSNKLQHDGSATNGMAVYQPATLTDDQEVSFTFVATGSSSDHWAVWARLDSPSATVSTANAYIFYTNGDGSVAIIEKITTGAVETTLFTAPSFVLTNGVTYTLKLRVNGTTLTGYINDFPVVTGTDSSITTGKYAALSTHVANAPLDNWTLRDAPVLSTPHTIWPKALYGWTTVGSRITRQAISNTGNPMRQHEAAFGAMVFPPNAGGAVDATATPATFTMTLAVLNPAAGAGAVPAPATLALVLAPQAPSPQAGATASPVTLPLTLLTLTPAPQAGSTVAPATLAMILALQTPAPKAGATASPTTLPMTLAPNAPGLSVGSSPAPATLPMTLAPQAPTPSAGSSVAPATLAMVETFPAVASSGGSSGTPATLALTLAPQAPSASAGASKTLAVLSMTLAPQAPAPSAGSTVAPAVLQLVLAPQSPSASGGSSAAPATLAMALAVLNPAAHGGATAAPATLPLVLAPQAAAVSAGSTASPSTLALTMSFLAVSTGSGAVASPSTFAMTLALLAPSLSSGASGHPTTLAMQMAINQAILSAGSTVNPATLAMQLVVQPVVPQSGATATPATAQYVVSIQPVSLSAGASAAPATALFSITFDSPTPSAGSTVDVDAIAMTMAWQALTFFVGTVPNPADDFTTAGYAGRRTTEGYESPSNITDGYAGRRISEGYDDGQYTDGYEGRRRTEDG